MADNKVDRGNLRRQAQRIESYRALVSKKRAIYKQASSIVKKSRSENIPFIYEAYQNNKIENEEKSKDKNKNAQSPASSIISSSSSSSQDNFQRGLLSGAQPIQSSSYQTEVELSSVMTRSASRKYASVGAIHNRVKIDEELKVLKRWPTNISYPIPGAPTDELKTIINNSFKHVLKYCKNAKVPLNIPKPEKKDQLKLVDGSINLIDLSPYLTQESIIVDDETHITLHLSDQFLNHQYINIISLNEEDENGTLVIEEEDIDSETITLHSGETYLLDNKIVSTNEPTFFNTIPALKNTYPDDPMYAISNDHTYAMKCSEQVSVPVPAQNVGDLDSLDFDKENEFKLETILNELLLNTAILKCLICGETPQEMISLLENVNI